MENLGDKVEEALPPYRAHDEPSPIVIRTTAVESQ